MRKSGNSPWIDQKDWGILLALLRPGGNENRMCEMPKHGQTLTFTLATNSLKPFRNGTFT